MLRKERIHNVLAEVGRAQHAARGKGPFHEKRQLDQVIERAAKLLQVGFDVGQDGTPLRGRVADRAAAPVERLVVVGGRGVAGEKNEAFGAGDHGAFAPGHQPSALHLLMGHELHFFLPMIGGPQRVRVWRAAGVRFERHVILGKSGAKPGPELPTINDVALGGALRI
jgi:hypothetical protein